MEIEALDSNSLAEAGFKKSWSEQSNAIANTDIHVCNFILHLSPGDPRLQAREEERT
jgi:hypothetical protein